MRLFCLLACLLFASPAHAQSTRLTGDLPRKEARPLETTPGLETEYGAVRVSDGYRLRTIVTRPAGARGKLPAIFLAQAVSCGSLELPPESQSTLRQLPLRSGYAFLRVERAGTGDSEGPACPELDYDTEVRHYREAFDQLARHAWVDPSRIVIFGSSLGSTTAPLIAQGKKVAGIFVQGGGALTYLERMIHFDRFYFERSGKFAPSEVRDRVLKSIRFNQEYLLGRKTPEQVARDNPDLAGVWESMRGTAEAPPHYGRPYAWHWQAADKDFLAAWAKVEAPVLVLYGQYDQFEPRHSHEMIADAVNALRPGTATFVEMPRIDHSLSAYPSAYAAYREEGGTLNRDALIVPVLDWLKKLRLNGRE